MHIHQLDKWKTPHNFDIDNRRGENRTRIVLVLTAATMLLEIIAGSIFNSMALLADGWHMATHTAAFAITIYAYRYARKHRNNPDYTFSTGKVTDLGGFASAVALGVVAFMMAMESVERFFMPREIFFNQAILVACFGLAINAASAVILNHEHDHDHGHSHDRNLKAAYFHVLADALTSLLAIVALIFGKYYGLTWLDPFMGIVGAALITRWAVGLLKGSSQILLDSGVPESTRNEVMSAIENDKDNRVVDLHAWHVSAKHIALEISLVTHYPQPPDYYKKLLENIKGIAHITVEVHHCEEEPCLAVE